MESQAAGAWPPGGQSPTGMAERFAAFSVFGGPLHALLVRLRLARGSNSAPTGSPSGIFFGPFWSSLLRWKTTCIGSLRWNSSPATFAYWLQFPCYSFAHRTGRLEWPYLPATWCFQAIRHRDELLGTAGLKFRADLGNSVEVVDKMSLIPASRRLFFCFAVAALAPMLPVALMLLPGDDIAAKLFKLRLGGG